MKPIFSEEKQFIEEQLGIILPDYCWRDGSYILLNHDSKEKLVSFKVESGKMILKYNKILSINGREILFNKGKKGKVLINYTWEEEYEQEREYLEDLEKESIDETVKYLRKYPNAQIRPGISGGKDSDVMWIISQKAFKIAGVTDWFIDVHNTTNDTADTYRHIKSDLNIGTENIHTPEKGMFQWLKEDKDYFLPSINVRNCCSQYKEGQVKKILDKNTEYIMLLGMRKHESQKRAFYDWDLNEAYKREGKEILIPEIWHRFLPIVNWRDEDVWLYILHNEVKANRMYSLGFNRVGCLCCPFSSDYTDLLIKKYYPLQWKMWEDMIRKNYVIWNVEKRLKWTLQEYIDGAWKEGMSKESFIIAKGKSEENVRALAEIKGVTVEIAEKYFERKCSGCDKKLNPDEVAINLKLFGRGMNTEKMKCKKHLCEDLGWTAKEYTQKIIEFREQDCNLF